jgi:hypothetical protein
MRRPSWRRSRRAARASRFTPSARGSAGYEEGTLVLHLVDTRTRELAYRASATAVIEEGGDRRRLEEAIERMLADLPRAINTGKGEGG